MGHASPARIAKKLQQKQNPKPNYSNAVGITVVDQKKLKQPFLAPPLPEDFHGWIGKLTITWGFFEQKLNATVVALAQEGGHVLDANWKWSSFDKRKELAKRLGKAVFAAHPTVLKELSEILGMSADLSWRRNAFAHGEIKSKLVNINPGGNPLRIEGEITVHARPNGKPTMLVYSQDGIERFFYQIGHLTGRMGEFMDQNAPLAMMDAKERAWLKVFQQKYF